MVIRRTALLVILLMAFPGLCPAVGSRDLAGSWVIRWDNDPGNQNRLNLSGDARLTGIYINDDKSQCPVRGNLEPQTRAIALQIECPKWGIRLQGVVTADATQVSGSYQAYTDATGTFTMNRP
jgi:hypothetical protein